ncbi:MAG TPA: adenosylmethionine--8-amino-7-oxononanoate transaminase [Alphaproteobacteria bacterium]|nr:adenosylmethionine--8-amino-7-oxononanoate transaminase [Alphaproteobacteria bacterium]
MSAEVAPVPRRLAEPDPAERDLIALDGRHVWHPFTQAATEPPPIAIARAQGATLVDVSGKTYLDLISSWWVNLHGHGEPRIADAIARQARELEQVIFAGFTHRPAVELAARLAKLLPAPLERVFYSDNGSTAVEVALKLAWQYWRNKGEGRRHFLAFEGGYHGDTFGAMAAGRGSGFYRPFDELLFDVDLLPYPASWIGDREIEAREAAALASLDAWLDAHGAAAAALIVEPLVQGAGGMRMCRPEFLQAATARARKAGALVIFDEVMTGFGRTGTLFAMEKAGIAPDIVCLAKGLTGGFLPLAATVATDEIYRAFLASSFDKAFAHGHSYTANPLGCAAGLASLDILTEVGTMARLAAIEQKHRERLARLVESGDWARPRVAGTIAAVTLGAHEPHYSAEVGAKLRAFFLARGLLIRPLGPVVYLMPPYCTTDAELDRAYDAIEAAGREIGRVG